MSATISNRERDKLPEWAVRTANQIEDLGFSKWVFDWEYPIPDPDRIERVQIRDESHIGQRADVSRYAEAMKRGDKFPPGVVTKDGRFIDWNTRARAAFKLNWVTFPVFIIQDDYDGAEQFLVQRFHLLGAAFNTGGPKPLTRDELTDAIRKAAADQDRWDTDSVAKHLHIKRGVVQSVFAQFRAEDRATRLGVPFNGSVNASTRAMLGQRSEKLADNSFREIARLAQDAGMTNADVGDLCKRVIDVSTGDADRHAIITAERDARELQISGFRASGKKRPPLSNRVRSCAEFLVGYMDKVEELVDANPHTRGEYVITVGNAAIVLERLVTAQRATLETVD